MVDGIQAIYPRGSGEEVRQKTGGWVGLEVGMYGNKMKQNCFVGVFQFLECNQQCSKEANEPGAGIKVVTRLA